MKKCLSIFLLLFFLTSCATKSEKAKNTIPYKYRTVEQVNMMCENQMRKNSNSKANAGSNIGNFLLGMMKAQEESWACDPLR